MTASAWERSGTPPLDGAQSAAVIERAEEWALENPGKGGTAAFYEEFGFLGNKWHEKKKTQANKTGSMSPLPRTG